MRLIQLLFKGSNLIVIANYSVAFRSFYQCSSVHCDILSFEMYMVISEATLLGRKYLTKGKFELCALLS